MSFFGFHPLIAQWFQQRFAGPTEPQQQGWPAIASGKHTLIAAPTGSGKTLTAFLACIDRLYKEWFAGELDDSTRVVYVSPLRALSNDMHRNLQVPLEEIFALTEQVMANEMDFPATPGSLFSKRQFVSPPQSKKPPLRVGLRTGDTPSSQRTALVRRPPHILVTTPESLYLMLTSAKARETLRNVETVIVDEIHALVRDKRGSHWSLTLERLEAVTERPLQRIGLSATQKPIERMAEYLIGQREEKCTIVDVGHGRELDLAIEIPPSDLGAVCMHEQWAEVNQRIVELIEQHRSTLIFVNTRRLAERITHQLTELLGEDHVGSHHGSLSADIRLKTEQKLKSGELKAVVATASLELGLDVGYIDLVIQLGSPRSIATFLQRIGRSGHSLGLIPKGRLFALTRDELLECMGLIRAVRHGRMDTTIIPEAPLDVLAQQIVAEIAAEEWDIEELFALIKRSYSYRDLKREDFDRVVGYLGEGISQTSGRGRTYLHHDHVQRRLRARKGARIAATTNGGAIPEIASYRVVAEPEKTVVGSLDEEFAVESNAGDVFLLGNTSWRIQHVRGGDVTVYDAQGAPPTIPFWQGEVPGRSLELSEEVARLREELETRVEDPSAAEEWLIEETSCCPFAASQAVTYAMAQKAAVGLLPSQKRVVYERFFDETGGMQLVVHAPFGAAINRAWGFAMRKRFCRSFDFELQATADDDGFILSLGPQHSFPIESLFPMLTAANAQGLLEQALLTAPVFQIRWRWNVTRSLLVMRSNKGKKVPPTLQRFRADDLLTAVFPRLTGCQEEHTGDIEMPDHPLVQQTMEDCLKEYVDLPGLKVILEQIAKGEIQQIARDTREPSPFSYELLNSNPYAFLDGGEVQERRARAVQSRRSLTVESVEDLGKLDPAAIAMVIAEAQPAIRDADELHDVLLSRIALPESREPELRRWFDQLVREERATRFERPDGRGAWASAERWPAVVAVFPEAMADPPIEVPSTVKQEWDSVEARLGMIRGLLEVSGPVTTAQIADELSLTGSQVDAALHALEGEGTVLRGQFTPTQSTEQANEEKPVEWCHRRILARVHRETVAGLRRQIEPVGVDVFIRFLARHHGLHKDSKRAGSNGVFEVVGQLQGWDIPAIAWERDVLPLRVEGYRPQWLDELCLSGELTWGRLFPPKKTGKRSRPMNSMTRSIPVGLLLREDANWLRAGRPDWGDEPLSSPAEHVLEVLEKNGAMFASDLADATQMLPAQLPDVLGELVSRGRVSADGFSGLRQLIQGTQMVSRRAIRQRLERQRTNQSAGRWSLWSVGMANVELSPPEITEQWAWQLLRRWGVMFRDLLSREPGAPRWFELLQIYRRLEARGEIRGGRFIAGVSGEQFALGETVRQLRHLRDQEPPGEYLVISAADPLNLVGILTDHPRVPAFASNRVLYRDGVALAWRRSQTVELFEDLSHPPPVVLSLLHGKLGLHQPFAQETPTVQASPVLPKPPEQPPRKPPLGRLF